MFNFLKKLFINTPSFKLGSLENPIDNRTINTAAFLTPVTLPDDFNPATVPVDYQSGSQCVAEAIHEAKEAFLIAAGTPVELSYQDLYDQCKLVDGIPEQEGTYPLVGAKIATTIGIASLAVYNTGDKAAIAADRAKYKMAGYAAVPTDFDSVCQAIFQGKVTASFMVDNNWFLGIITKVLNSIGRHYTWLYGFKRSAQIVRGQNSWGIGWIGKVAGFIDPSLAAGHFDVFWPDVVSGDVQDIYMFTDLIPAPIIQHVQTLNYYFKNFLAFGQTSYDVMQLQKRLQKEGYFPITQSFTQYYGIVTATAVKAYQAAHGIFADGKNVGPLTLKVLNGAVGLSLIDAQIHVESEGNDYAVGDTNLPQHAYGCLQIRQGDVDQVNAKLGTSYKAQDCLGNRALAIKMWQTYWEIYPIMNTDEKKAKAWNGGIGWENIYNLPVKTKAQQKYCDNIDAYWKKVSALM